MIKTNEHSDNLLELRNVSLRERKPFPLCFLATDLVLASITEPGLLQSPLNNTAAGILPLAQPTSVFPHPPSFLVDTYLLQNFQRHVLPTLYFPGSHSFHICSSYTDRVYFLAYNFYSYLPDLVQVITLISSFTSTS